MKGPLTDQVRIKHILDAISEVEGYLQSASIEGFLSNSEKRFATIKQIEIIGEACSRITQEFKDAHHEIEWRSILGFRNVSIHEYFGVNFHIVWEIDRYDLPILKEHFSKFV